ncbi:PH domain-containing protein [Sporosarcina sp. 6E9]|uniref:PH domain-containing protein n=1 Tax=Sporosarcina sp. 6E9 TaxID=2819235 RepID=UPI001AC0B2B6|nr:PH domain-containing protein [Sporosarcina sp. 6E9]MBO1909913.1 PH domain-containing protein [Microvirga sp. 3-52]
MIFRSKVDSFFVKFILIMILIIGLVTLLPLFAVGGGQLLVVLISALTFLVSTGIILWCSFSIKYVFHEEHLFVKGGPFRSRIPYESITKVSPTSAIFTGYRILSSRDSIEIFNRTTVLGSVKISPNDQKGFVAELKKRCPNLRIQE